MIRSLALAALLAACGSTAGDGETSSSAVTSCLYGNHCASYAAGSILPSQPLDEATGRFYDAWKAKYVVAGCGGHYVHAADTGGKGISISEGHGYGMVITAMMAGHDPNARAVFDGMFRFFRAHPSKNSPDLMAWQQVEGCGDNPDGGDDSATDGDLDIAFALLVAARQWTGGTIDYGAEAKKVIAAAKAHEIESTTQLPLLGDWATPDDAKHYATRPSDMMFDHFRAFGWTSSIDASYRLLDRMQTQFSPHAGLVPDFVVDTNRAAKPAPPSFLEDTTDGQYGYNACRVPWRLATDALVSGEPRARTALGKLNSFFRDVTNGNPQKIVDGYELGGAKVGSDRELAFLAPLAVSAMTDSGNRAWLDSLTKAIVETRIDDSAYFGNTIKMLSLLVLSNNWRAPEE